MLLVLSPNYKLIMHALLKIHILQYNHADSITVRLFTSAVSLMPHSILYMVILN